MKPLHEKMGIKQGMRGILVHAPADAREAIDPPGVDIASRLRGSFDYIHLFVKSQAGLDQVFPRLKRHLKPTGMLWVSWPKSGKLETDLRLANIIKTGYSRGMVESKTLSINGTWSGIKFTHPKAGKVYRNSYGRLKKIRGGQIKAKSDATL